MKRVYERPTLTTLNLPGSRAEDPTPEGMCKNGDYVGDPDWGLCYYGGQPGCSTSCCTGGEPQAQARCGVGISPLN